MRYNKLVRDLIPEIIKQDNKIPITHIANNQEYWKKLKTKLQEEVDEYLDSEDKKELADILEVINAICDFKKINKAKLESIRQQKTQKRGGFKKKIILEQTKSNT